MLLMAWDKRNVFWQALLSAVLIFGVGLLLGIAFEDYRNKNVEETLLNSELNVLDSQLLGTVSRDLDVSCEEGFTSLIKFADDIYFEAKKLEDYEQSSQLTSLLGILHKRYDLLRTILWVQAIELKKRCDDSFHTVVYLYDYNDVSPALESEQIVFSRVLEDLKEKHGNSIVLIPIAVDFGLASVGLIVENYKIKEMPAVIVDESIVIRNIEDLGRLEEYLFGI